MATLRDLEERLVKSNLLTRGKGLWQNEFHRYDVFTHTMVCVRNVRRLTDDPHLIVAAYLHDVGKPVVKRPKLKDGQPVVTPDGRAYHKFTGHEEAGKKIVLSMNPSLFLEYGLDQKKIAELVGAHYRPMRGIKAMRKAKGWQAFLREFVSLRRDLDEVPGVSPGEIMTLFLADTLAKGSQIPDKDELLLLYEIIAENKNYLLLKLYSIMKGRYQ